MFLDGIRPLIEKLRAFDRGFEVLLRRKTVTGKVLHDTFDIADQRFRPLGEQRRLADRGFEVFLGCEPIIGKMFDHRSKSLRQFILSAFGLLAQERSFVVAQLEYLLAAFK